MKATFNTRRETIDTFYISNYKSMSGKFNFHSPIELLFVRRGEARVWINDVEATVRENEIAIALSFDTHSFVSTEEGEYTILFISPTMCPAFMEAVRHKNAHNPVVREVRVAERIFAALDMLADEGMNSIEQTGYIHVILGAIMGQLDLADIRSVGNDALITRLFFYINDHYKEDISVASVAQAMGYDRYYLSKCFRASFQMSINRYITTLRLKNAIMMMQDRSNSVTKCAMESGFGSMRTFYRAFTEEFGFPPREYLNRSI